jgi:hypothetical protein
MSLAVTGTALVSFYLNEKEDMLVQERSFDARIQIACFTGWTFFIHFLGLK